MSNKTTIKTMFEMTDCLETFKRKLKDNLCAVISIGSYTTGYYLEKWSDIDLLIVLNKISFRDKELISEIKIALEERYERRFGINILTKEEAISPIKPVFSLDGKTLQGLLELASTPERLLYCDSKNIKFYVPDNETVRSYSLSNIAMFLLRNRKTLTSSNFEDENKLRFTVEKEIRAAFIITKLAVQLKSNYTCASYSEVIDQAVDLFPDFAFVQLTDNKNLIDNWDEKIGREKLLDTLSKTDTFIESFSRFIFQQKDK